MLQQESVNAATEKAKAGVTTLLGGITKVLTVEAEDLHDTPIVYSQQIFNRAQVQQKHWCCSS